MAAAAPAQWSPADVALTRFSASGTSGAGYKRLFGSDLAFRDDGALALSVDSGVGARPSYALGGLSNVWGAGILPYADRDLDGWPIGARDLVDHYRAVFDFIPYAAEQDELAERYPLIGEPDGPLLRSQAGEQLLARLRRHEARLSDAGFTSAPRVWRCASGTRRRARAAATARTAWTDAHTVTSTTPRRRSSSCAARG